MPSDKQACSVNGYNAPAPALSACDDDASTIWHHPRHDGTSKGDSKGSSKDHCSSGASSSDGQTKARQEQRKQSSPLCVAMAGTWVKMDQKGAGPGARSSHAITLVGDTAYSFGGEFIPRVPVDNTMYAFDLKAQTWSALDATGDVPPPRVGVTMAAVGGTVFTFGGRDLEHKELNELYSFDTATRTWTLLSSGSDGPPHRSYHSMVADGGGGQVYVFGGCGDAGRLNDL